MASLLVRVASTRHQATVVTMIQSVSGVLARLAQLHQIEPHQKHAKSAFLNEWLRKNIQWLAGGVKT